MAGTVTVEYLRKLVNLAPMPFLVRPGCGLDRDRTIASLTTAVAKDVAAASAGAPSGTNALPLRICAGLQAAGSAGRIVRPVPHSG